MNLSSKDRYLIKTKGLIIKTLTFNYFVIKKIIKKELPIKVSERVLDIGCGTGILSTLFSNANYTGIDINKKLISFAKENYKKKFSEMSIDKLEFPANTFDKVIISGVIHHLNNKTAKLGLDQIKKVLKNGGKILIIEAIPPISKYNLIGQYLRYRDEGDFVRGLDEYENLFKSRFDIIKKYEQKGGLFDYGVFLLKKIN